MFDAKDLTAWVDLSTKCNAACPQCHRTNPKNLKKVDWLPQIEWSLSTFKKAFPVESLNIYSRFQICGTWGDPLMCDDLLDITKYIIDNSNADIILNTNGSLKHTDWWWELGVIGDKRLTVYFTVDGINQEQHSKYRTRTSLRNILNNMSVLSNTNAIANAFTVIFKHNEENVLDIIELVRSNGAEHIFIVPSNRFNTVGDGFIYFDRGIKNTLYVSSFSETIDIKLKDYNVNELRDILGI